MNHGPELGAALAAGQRQPQGTQVTSGRLQLPHGLACVTVCELSEALGGAGCVLRSEIWCASELPR